MTGEVRPSGVSAVDTQREIAEEELRTYAERIMGKSSGDIATILGFAGLAAPIFRVVEVALFIVLFGPALLVATFAVLRGPISAIDAHAPPVPPAASGARACMIGGDEGNGL